MAGVVKYSYIMLEIEKCGESMKTPLRYQCTELDCVPNTITN